MVAEAMEQERLLVHKALPLERRPGKESSAATGLVSKRVEPFQTWFSTRGECEPALGLLNTSGSQAHPRPSPDPAPLILCRPTRKNKYSRRKSNQICHRMQTLKEEIKSKTEMG